MFKIIPMFGWGGYKWRGKSKGDGNILILVHSGHPSPFLSSPLPLSSSVLDIPYDFIYSENLLDKWFLHAWQA